MLASDTQALCIVTPSLIYNTEINTSSCLGLLKEIVTDRTLAGQTIEDNIVLVAACNPCRMTATTHGKTARQVDRAEDWISGHYQVLPLPPSLERLKWAFGALNPTQEKEFIGRRIDLLAKRLKLTSNDCVAATESLVTAQQEVRRIATDDLRQSQASGTLSDTEEDVVRRASSVVSLRDIQRALSVFEYVVELPGLFKPLDGNPRLCMKLAIAVVYYLRLNTSGRTSFSTRMMELPFDSSDAMSFDETLAASIGHVVDGTHFDTGIAKTRGLQENLFMTLVCIVSRTPLIIVGPPGCSKVRQ